MDAAGESAELTLALAEIFSGEIDFNNELQPDDRFALSFERWNREGRPSTYGAIERGRVPQRRTRAARDPLHDARRQAGVLRRAGALAAPLLPEVAAEVRAAHHVALFAAPHASRARHGARASRRRLRRADRRAGRRGLVRHRRLGHLRQRERPHGAPAPCRRVPVVLPAPVGVRPRHPRRRARRARDRRSAASARPASRPVRTCTTGCSATASGWTRVREHRNMPPGEPVPASALADFAAERDKALARSRRPQGPGAQDSGLSQASAGSD